MMHYLFLFALLLLPLSRSEALDLSLEDCLQRAEQNDRGLQASQAHQQSLEEDVNIARKNFLPTFKLAASYTLLDRPTRLIIESDVFGPGLPPEDVAQIGDRRFFSASLIMEQPLFEGGNLIQGLNRSRSLMEQFRLEILHQQNVLQRDIEESFFRVLNAQLYRQTSEKMLAIHRERLRLIQEQRREGQLRDEDVLAQQVELALSESEVYRSRSREGVLLAYLRNSLYLGQEVSISLKTPENYRKLKEDTPDFTLSALDHRNDYLALQKQLDAKEAEAKEAQSRLYPQISVFGEYTRQRENNLDRNEVWAAGARLEWSIFEWGKNLAEVRRVRAEKLRAQRQKEAYAQKIRNETNDHWGAVREKESLITAWILKTRYNESKLQRLLDEFHEGKTTLVEVLAQEAELVASYNMYREVINDMEIARAYLQAAVGVSLDPWLVTEKIYQPDLNRVNTFLKHLSDATNTQPGNLPN